MMINRDVEERAIRSFLEDLNRKSYLYSALLDAINTQLSSRNVNIFDNGQSHYDKGFFVSTQYGESLGTFDNLQQAIECAFTYYNENPPDDTPDIHG